MSKVQMSQEQFEVLIGRVETLEAEVKSLKEQSTKRETSKSTREMTDDDALRILNGDLKDKSHKECAEILGLSYGQIYSCRLEFTFKQVHHKLSKENFRNPWIKARS